MKFFCFALPPGWADTHPAPGVPIRFFCRLSRECWLWLALQGWDDPEESAYRYGCNQKLTGRNARLVDRSDGFALY